MTRARWMSRHRSRPFALAALLTCALLVLRAVPVEALDPDTDAVVRADGDCLRLRAQPSLQGVELTCIPEGSVVRVLAGTVGPIDGFRWQRIAFAGQEGWSVEQYLRAVQPSPVPTPAPGPTVAPTPLPVPTLSGSVPPGGIGLAVWGGGPIDRIPPAAAPQGCTLRAIWVTRGGEFVGYIYGAPVIVNGAWNALYPDGSLPPSTALLLVCAASAGTPAPVPTVPPTPVPTPGVPPGIPPRPPGPAGNG